MIFELSMNLKVFNLCHKTEKYYNQIIVFFLSLYLNFKVIRVMNDIELVKKYLSGDNKSFDMLYEKYADKIYKFIYLKTSNVEVAQDIVSEVFLSVLDNIDSFNLDENSSFNSWIYRIAYNKIVDFYKKSEKQKPMKYEIIQIFDIQKI